MSISGRRRVDRTAKSETADNAGRRQVRQLGNFLQNLLFVNLGGSFAVDIQRQRFFFADGVGNLQQTLVGNSGGNDILCQIAHHVSCRTVNLAGIFSRKSSAAVRRITAVGVGDNFASGKAAVTVGTADDKTSGRIDQQPNVIGKKRFRNAATDDRQNQFPNFFQRQMLAMLGG